MRFLALLLIAVSATGTAQTPVTLVHVHGLAYSADGKRLMIPSHHGLAVYEDGKWSKAPGPQHDYMGFAASAHGLYSSGHPAPGSGLVNPFGLIRSRDGGKSWDKLGLEGESDFHLLATGWNTNALYVWNTSANSRMREPGLHYTLNDGLAWKSARGEGLDGNPQALAVHPDDAAMVAVATSSGVYLSRDHGARFAPLAKGQALSVFFDLDGKQIWYATFDGQPRLSRAPLSGGSASNATLPPLRDDAVGYITQNPKQRELYAIATFRRTVLLSKDAGRTWTPIAEGGVAAVN
jgi:photosystem II stability/assembly factor-like uncharacterized protein